MEIGSNLVPVGAVSSLVAVCLPGSLECRVCLLRLPVIVRLGLSLSVPTVESTVSGTVPGSNLNPETCPSESANGKFFRIVDSAACPGGTGSSCRQ
jgi:hypothetical protein